VTKIKKDSAATVDSDVFSYIFEILRSVCGFAREVSAIVMEF
jgi:hypothetical protein